MAFVEGGSSDRDWIVGNIVVVGVDTVEDIVEDMMDIFGPVVVH